MEWSLHLDKADTTSNQHKTLICRLCLAQTTTYFSLIDDTAASEMLEALTSLRILPTDEISTVMCLKCHLNLKLAFSIQQNMLKAEQRFRERRLPTPVKEEYDDEEELTEAEVEVQSVEKLPETVKEPSEKTRKILSMLKTHTCDVCGKVKPSKSSLRQHKYNVHVEQECPICNKKITQTNLKRHIARHKDGFSMCELCGISVISQDLRVHMYYKHREHNYKCGYCDKIFKKKNKRLAHERREHLDEANFVCDTCGKKFYQNACLQKHISGTHLKLRPYICEFCHVGFSSRYALKTHRRIHTNETPYKCDFCGSGFKQRVSLRAHLKSRHNVEEELTCECNICGKKFGSKAALISHGRVH